MKKKLFIAGAIVLFVFTALWAAEWAAVVGTVVTPTNAPQTTNLVLVASHTGGGWSNRSVSLINLAAALRGMTTNSVYASNIFGVGGYADNNAIIYNNGGTLDGTNAFTITGNVFEILDTAYFKPGDNFDTFSYPMINGIGYLTNGIQTNRFVYIDMLGNLVVGQLTVTNTLYARTNVNVGGDLNVTNDINMVGGTGGNIDIYDTNGANFTRIQSLTNGLKNWDSKLQLSVAAAPSDNDVLSYESTGDYWTNKAASGSLPTTTEGDLVLYTNSTNARLPVGAAGATLVSDGSYPIWRTPQTYRLLVEDYFVGDGTSDGRLGSAAWDVNTASGGATELLDIATESYILGTRGSNASARAGARIGPPTYYGIVLTNWITHFYARVFTGSNATAGENWTYRIGFQDSETGPSTDGVYMEATNNLWRLNTAVGGTGENTASISNIVALGWQTIGFVCDSRAGQNLVTMYCGATLSGMVPVATNTLNIPASGCTFMFFDRVSASDGYWHTNALDWVWSFQRK